MCYAVINGNMETGNAEQNKIWLSDGMVDMLYSKYSAERRMGSSPMRATQYEET